MNTALRMSIKQWAPEDRPTERLQRLGAESLTDAELLAILIGSGTQQYSAVDIGNQVLGRFNHNLNTLGKGIGKTQADSDTRTASRNEHCHTYLQPHAA